MNKGMFSENRKLMFLVLLFVVGVVVVVVTTISSRSGQRVSFKGTEVD